MLLPTIILGLYIGKGTVQKADRSMMEMLQSIEVNQSDDSTGGSTQQGFQISFSAQRPAGANAEYALVKDPRLAPGNRVVITVTIKARPRVLMDGIITHQQLPFGNNDASFVLMGSDISVLMDLEDKNLSFKGMKHKEVVEKILQPYAKFGIKTEVTSPKVKWPMEPPEQMPMQGGVTDRAYLRHLAKAYGFIFRVGPGDKPGKSVAYWGPPPRNSAEQVALSVNMGSGTNVETINFSHDALAPTQVNTAVANADKDKPSETEVQKSTRTPALAKKSSLGTNTTLMRKMWLGYAGPDATEAKARAQSIANQSSDQAVSGSGTVDTPRYGDILTAPGIVSVRGAGASFDGKYYVKSVKHRINVAEYKQDFTITREGVGTKTQSVRTR